MPGLIKVAIAGINGRMGRVSAACILDDPDLQLVGGFDRAHAPCVGWDVGKIINRADTGILISNSLEELPRSLGVDVLLDFSIAEAAAHNGAKALDLGIRPVIGTSGLPQDQIHILAGLASAKRLGALIIPNFSLGAVLMMEFAKQAGAYF